MEEPILNVHNKDEYPPAHTCEHILNATMVKKFGCQRSFSNHIEKKKSKCDYHFDRPITDVEIADIEAIVNSVIRQNLPVTYKFITIDEAKQHFFIERLPEDVSDAIRIVSIGDYDACPCIGTHVENTSEIGTFKIISYDYNDNVLRIRFKLLQLQ